LPAHELDVHAYFMLAYGDALASEAALCGCAPDYLRFAGVRGLHHIQTIVETSVCACVCVCVGVCKCVCKCVCVCV